mgnify:CR=1 FL=1
MKTVYLNEDNTIREIIPEYALPPEKWYSEAFARRCVEVQDGGSTTPKRDRPPRTQDRRGRNRPRQRTLLWRCWPTMRSCFACWKSPLILSKKEGKDMNTVFNLCKLLIDRGRTDGLQDKMDVYLAADRLTPEEYQELAAQLTK